MLDALKLEAGAFQIGLDKIGGARLFDQTGLILLKLGQHALKF